MLLALVAAILLVATTATTALSLQGASQALLRGEGEAIVRAIDDDLERPTSDVKLQGLLEKFRPEGVTYIGFIEGPVRSRPPADRPDEASRETAGPLQPGPVRSRPPADRPDEASRETAGPLQPGPVRSRPLDDRPDTHPFPRPPEEPREVFAAGAPQLGRLEDAAPSFRVADQGVRIVQPSFRRPAGRPPMAGPPRQGPRRDPPLLVVEFTPHVATALRGTLTRAGFVGAFAVIVLLGSAAMIVRYIQAAARSASQAEAQRRLLALGEMSAVMAHELRNPLASLKGHAQLFAEDLEETDEVSGSSRDRVARVIAEATRMERLTAALLAFVRDAPLDCAEVAVGDLYAAAAERLSAAERGRIVLGPNAASERLVVDGARIACALGNLLENAILAAKTSVEVTVVSEADTVVFEVCDDGPGLPAAVSGRMGPGDHEALFEPFFTTHTRGTGLGLAIARRIAHQHGGTLTAENRSTNAGARFRLSLPRRNR